MRKLDPEKITHAKAVLEQKKVFSFDQLLSLLECSTRYGRTKLKQWRTYNSYNKNGRYYALPEVPIFDENGLWHYGDIYFSKHGTLKKTVIQLVRQSSAGLSGNQIEEIVRVPSRSYLHNFRNEQGICRERYQGVFIYFSNDVDRKNQQVKKRIETIINGKQISDADAIVMLVELIKNPKITIEDLTHLPEIEIKNYSHQIIHEFLRQHDLVKKTLDTKL